MNRIRHAFYVLAVLAITVPVQAQVSTGTPPFGSFGGGPFDAINLGDLNVFFSVSVRHKAGRITPFIYNINYNSSVWYPTSVNGQQTWQPVSNYGWQYPTAGGYLTNQTVATVTQPCNPPGNMNPITYHVFAFWAFHDSNGGTHPTNMNNNDWNGTGCSIPPGNIATGPTTDGSGYVINMNGYSGTVTGPDGMTYSVPMGAFTTASTFKDANGNQISVDSSGNFTDTLGQNVLSASGTNPKTLTYTAPNTSPATWTIYYTASSIQTHFGCSGISEYSALNVLLPTKIQLPDGTAYQFSYEQTAGYAAGVTTGRLNQVTLPTGGTITYSYPTTQGGTNTINCADGSAPTSAWGPSLTRTVSPGGTWTYSRTQVSGNHWQTKITTPPDPANSPAVGNDTIVDFQLDSSANQYGNTHNFYETQRQIYQGPSTGTLLLTTTTCWNGNTSSCPTTAVSSPISQKIVTSIYPGTNGKQSKVQYLFWNTYGLLTEVDQYDWALGGPGGLLRKTQYAYASLGNGIVNRPSSISVYDGPSSSLIAKRTFTYDEGTPQPTSNTPQHVSIGGSRGNPTTISTLATTWLTGHISYYDTGTVYQKTDVNGAVTTYNYDSSPQAPSTTKSCGNSFPTSVTLPITGLSSLASTTYDCVGGVVTQVKDLDGNATNTAYSDPSFWRPASVQDPMMATANFTYTAPLNGGPARTESSMLFNGSASISEQLVTLDALGRPLYSQNREDPASGDYVTTGVTYDVLGRPIQSTMPCVASSGNGCPSAAKATSTFDAFGRVTQVTDGGTPTPGWVKYTYTQYDVLQEVGPAPSGENTKQKQLQYDGLGRLINVCELTNLTGYGQCIVQGSPNGYMTSYTYGVNALGYPKMTVWQNGQQRVYTYDLAGRLTSEQNPESGTTTYTYDSDSSGNCSGTYIGDLVKVTDAKGNKICYQYDAIHRNTQITYPSGPDAANTASKTFVYDSATFNGTAMLNPKGRLVESYTGSSGSKITDEFFQYSVRGELTDTWECTPHSGTNGCLSVSNYYKVTAGFWENGALKTLSSNISGLPTQTYSVDPMGRTSAVTASSGQNPVTSTSFNLSAFTSSVTFGSGDSDTFYFDQNTGRQTKYVLSVNGQTDTGQTTWNPNGSLQTLQITDNIASTSDTQTCNFSHDDLARISSVNCVNGGTNKWNQSFVFDALGNISKTSTGPGITFPGSLPSLAYSTSTNWLTTVSGCVGSPTYDLDGQMTYDCTHNYTWDSGHKMHSVDANPSTCSTSGQCLTYDALGRMVEKASGSTYTQIVYGPTGKFATMNGQTTLVKAYIPLPGAQAVYTSQSLITTNKIAYYRHSDHLGSSRLATTPTRTLYSSTAYAPYGEPYSQAGTTDLFFTGQEQDTVTGMHDFLLRKYVPVQGRWLSPDPAGMAAASPANPQSWNRYAYVSNNPMGSVDALGLCGGMTQQVSATLVDENGNPIGEGNTATTIDPPCDYWEGGWNGVLSFLQGGGDYNGPPSISSVVPPAQLPNLPPVKPVMPHNPLADCIKNLFDVTMAAFEEAQIGEGGSFSGVQAGVFRGAGIPLAPGPYNFTISFDMSHNSGQLSVMYAEAGGGTNMFVSQGVGQPAMFLPAQGLTYSSNPFHPYVAFNTSLPTIQFDQLWELGNALGFISGRFAPNPNVQPGAANTEDGHALTTCLNMTQP